MNCKSERTESRIGADVAGGPLASDVLLAGRQGQHPAAPSVGVDALAGETSWHLADKLVPAGEQAEMGSAEIERVAERLPFGRDDVRSHLARRDNGAERQDFRYRDDEQRAGVVAVSGEIGIVPNFTKKIRVLHDDAGSVTTNELGKILAAAGSRIPRAELEADEASIALAHLAVMRMEPARQHRLSPPGQTIGHHHRLGAGRRTVIERRVGNLHACQHRNLGLEFEQILQGSLRQLWLVRGVGGQKLTALDQMVNRGRDVVPISTAADEERDRTSRDVACGDARYGALD